MQVTLIAYTLIRVTIPTVQPKIVWPLGQKLIVLCCFTTQRNQLASTQVVETLEKTQTWHLSVLAVTTAYLTDSF